MEPFIGEIKAVGFNFAPRGWAFCNGQLMPISGNEALFSLLGTTYGGDGRTTFALPDLRGRVPIHAGQGVGLSPYREGQRGGAENVVLNTNQMPSHTHIATAKGAGAADSGSPAGNTWADSEVYSSQAPSEVMNSGAITVSSAGGNLSHENRPPYLVVNYVIALVGVFPSRS